MTVGFTSTLGCPVVLDSLHISLDANVLAFVSCSGTLGPKKRSVKDDFSHGSILAKN
jgi:hypothetical protein